MKIKKYGKGGMMDYASGGMLKALLDDPKQREMAKKMLSKNYEGGGMMPDYGDGGYMKYNHGGYMGNEQMVIVTADTLEEASIAIMAAVEAGNMMPTHYKIKACFYADEG